MFFEYVTLLCTVIKMWSQCQLLHLQVDITQCSPNPVLPTALVGPKDKMNGLNRELLPRSPLLQQAQQCSEDPPFAQTYSVTSQHTACFIYLLKLELECFSRLLQINQISIHHLPSYRCLSKHKEHIAFTTTFCHCLSWYSPL